MKGPASPRGGLFDALPQDVRLTARGLWRARTFTVGAAMTLALGLAGVTIMFASTKAVLLDSLPIADQHQVILAWKELRAAGSARYPFGDTEIDAVARASRLIAQAAGVTRNGAGS